MLMAPVSEDPHHPALPGVAAGPDYPRRRRGLTRARPGPGLLAAFEDLYDPHHLDITGNSSDEGCEPFVTFFTAIRESPVTLALDIHGSVWHPMPVLDLHSLHILPARELKMPSASSCWKSASPAGLS
jgi:hypothetical protein